MVLSNCQIAPSIFPSAQPLHPQRTLRLYSVMQNGAIDNSNQMRLDEMDRQNAPALQQGDFCLYGFAIAREGRQNQKNRRHRSQSWSSLHRRLSRTEI